MDGGPAGTGIGQPVRRREDLRLLTGNGCYSDDVSLPGEDVLADGLQPLPNIANSHPADISIQNKDGSPAVRPQQTAIIWPEVCHVGEIVAAIVATGLAAAKDAAERVAVDYEPLPAVTHSLVAAEPGAPRARRDSANIILDGEVGDVAATASAFTRAAH